MDEQPLPVAKRQKTKQDEGNTTGLTRGAAAAKKESPTSFTDLLRSLPANIVAKYIYPFAVKVVKNREELIKVVDEYLDGFYTEGDGDEASWFDEEDEEEGEDTPSYIEVAEGQDASSTLSDDHISSDPSHQNSSMEPRGGDEPQDGEKTTTGFVHARRVYCPIGDWDVSQVDDFTSVFDHLRNRNARNFNEDLSRWNVANGTSFVRMFYGCHVFQSDLSCWNVANATDMSFMFWSCTNFKSDVSRWKTTNANSFCFMFWSCTNFNSDVSDWNVANATNVSGMFAGCTIFNSDLSRWNVANAHAFSWMFDGCTSFNSDLSRWNVANATNFSWMFDECTSFNSDVSRWNVANAIRNMRSMFRWCDSFDRTFVATWPLPDAQSVESLFE
jgi:surface protein